MTDSFKPRHCEWCHKKLQSTTKYTACSYMDECQNMSFVEKQQWYLYSKVLPWAGHDRKQELFTLTAQVIKNTCEEIHKEVLKLYEKDDAPIEYQLTYSEGLRRVEDIITNITTH